MLATNVHAAVAQAMRASARTLPAAQSLSASSAASRALLARRTFLVTPSYKARVAVRGYATATATATKKATVTKTTKPRAAAAKGAKKPAAKKAPVKAKAKAKKPAAKPKKKKVAAKKPAPKKRVKKELTEEQKKIALRRLLKKTALLGEEPKRLPYTPWLAYVHENLQAMTAKGVSDVAARNQTFSENMTRLAAGFKNLSTSERSRIDQIVKDNRAANVANLKKWVLTHTVEEIHAANNARARLNRDFPTVSVGPKIVDERQPKRPCTAFAHFVKARTAGTTGHITLKDLGASWHTLAESDKKPYIDLMEADQVRYTKDVEASGLRTSLSA